MKALDGPQAILDATTNQHDKYEQGVVRHNYIMQDYLMRDSAPPLQHCGWKFATR